MTVPESFAQNLTPKQRISTANHTMQVNIGLKCNLGCRHCHLECGPKRNETMSRETMEKLFELYEAGGFKVLDITGGAPELNENFEWLIGEAAERSIPTIVRTNLTLLVDSKFAHLPQLFADLKVQLVASLPCYLEDNVDSIRGKGVYEKSISALKVLNVLGYGSRPELTLDLVYSPAKPVLPGCQTDLQAAYAARLRKDHGIVFNRLFVITNMDIGRFGQQIEKSSSHEEYAKLLKDNFNPATLENMMCCHQISVGYDGSLYDCDFNLALGQKASPAHISKTSGLDLLGRTIHFAQHCYGCTAGAGSS